VATAPSAAEPATGTTPASILRPAIVYSILFGAQGAYLPYISIFLASTGLDLGTVGALIALYAGVTLVAAPSWGAVADALGDVRGPVLVAAIASTAATALLATAGTPVTIALAIALLAASFAGIIPMVDSQSVRFVGPRDRFGLARAPGSAAFVVVAFATGVVVGTAGPRGIFVVYAPLTLLIGLAAWILLALPRRGGKPVGSGRGAGALARRALAGLSPATIVDVLRAPSFGPFFAASVLIWTSHAMLQGFVSLRIVALGGDAPVVAATWSLGALLEVVLMSGFPWFARRFGTERLIVVGALGFALRAAITAVAPDPLTIVLASLFGGVGFSFVYVGVVTWVSATVDRRTQATAQGIFTGTANGMGAIGGSILGGAIGGAFGLPILFGVAAVGYAVGGFVVWRAVGRRRPMRPAGIAREARPPTHDGAP
jgi:PPP family 3-phenylpropionic acid transporter